MRRSEPLRSQARAFIDEAEFAAAMSGIIWLVSHGGVASEQLYDKLGLAYPDIQIRQRPLRGVVSHLPAPFRTGPRKCIYLFGGPIDAIISQIRRGYYDNPRKLKNNLLYPGIHSLHDLLSINDQDPFGINMQFRLFCVEVSDYPILLLKRSAISNHLSFISEFAEVGDTLEWIERPRETDRASVSREALNHLEHLYGFTAAIMEQMPDIALRLPVWTTGYRYRFEPSDVIGFHPILKSMSFAPDFIKGLTGTAAASGRLRLKHSYEWMNAAGEHLCFVNVRHDIVESGLGSIGYILKINYDTGNVFKVSHSDFVEDRIFSGSEDPRYFWRGGHLGVIFNSLCQDNTRRMFIYFEHLDQCIKLYVDGFSFQDIEKNWTVLVVADVIYIIYSLNPTIVFRLDDDKTGCCSIVSEHSFAYPPIAPLYPYGGTSLCLWAWPYFVGLVHTRSPYRPAFVIFDAEKLCVVAVGEPFSVPEPEEAVKWRDLDVQYPYHLEIGGGRCEAWIECQYRCPTLYRFDFTRFCEVASTLITVQPVFGGNPEPGR